MELQTVGIMDYIILNSVFVLRMSIELLYFKSQDQVVKTTRSLANGYFASNLNQCLVSRYDWYDFYLPKRNKILSYPRPVQNLCFHSDVLSTEFLVCLIYINDMFIYVIKQRNVKYFFFLRERYCYR